jgi:hypothetical protein
VAFVIWAASAAKTSPVNPQATLEPNKKQLQPQHSTVVITILFLFSKQNKKTEHGRKISQLFSLNRASPTAIRSYWRVKIQKYRRTCREGHLLMSELSPRNSRVSALTWEGWSRRAPHYQLTLPVSESTCSRSAAWKPGNSPPLNVNPGLWCTYFQAPSLLAHHRGHSIRAAHYESSMPWYFLSPYSFAWLLKSHAAQPI